ncbi:MAG TPA: radical SAM protein [Methanotrichaceae archaeon]|nr:radical SAM protein [Methanotrichaceae archaeon]
MRASSYNIYVNLIEDDAYLIVQGYTGAIDKVNGAVYRYLKSDGKDGSATSSTVQHLERRGYLTERSPDEEREKVRKIAEIIHKRSLKGAGFTFAPTFSCQLRCTYCYEAHISHREDEASLAVMTSEHVRSAYAAIDEIIERFGKRPPTEVTLYGGEPLLARNHDIVSEIVEEGVRRKLRFKAITNGFDLMKYEDLLGTDKIYFLQITIDGPEEIHNRRRFARNGRPTFNEICRGVQLALDRGCAVALRTNIDRSNLKGLAELNRFYMEMGWSRNPKFHPYAFTTFGESKENLLEPMEFLEASSGLIPRTEGQRSIKTNFGIDYCFNGLLRSRTIPSLHPTYCGSNSGGYIFGPDGYIYTCWDEVGLDEGRIGRYMPDLVWNEERSSEWLSRSIANIPECLNCSYGLICGGGCPRRAKKTYGSMRKPYCHQFSELFLHLVPILYRDNARAIEEMGKRALDESRDPCQETPLH